MNCLSEKRTEKPKAETYVQCIKSDRGVTPRLKDNTRQRDKDRLTK